MGWLDGEVVLVTGGASGLGRAIVDRFVEEGAEVAVFDRSADKLDAVSEHHGDAVLPVAGDVRSWDDNERAVAETVSRFGRLDCFVGNAGIWDFSSPLTNLAGPVVHDAVVEVLSVNVVGYILGARASIDALRASEGSMIFTASNAGFYPGGGGVGYTASKHAVVGLVRQLAYELCPDIRVNGVAPGGLLSDLRGPSALGLDQIAISSIPIEEVLERISALERRPSASDYTGHYVLLASRENNRTVTGSVHNCDGGVGVEGRRMKERAISDLLPE